jgi:ABC-type multidrug transport system permease subunit
MLNQTAIGTGPWPRKEIQLSRQPWLLRIGRMNQALVVPPMPRRWVGFLYRHPKLTFLLMGAFFLLFGFTSVNLFVVLKANIELFVEYGAMVIEDGALQQLFEIIGSSYLSIVFYVFFKVCERILIERLTGKPLGEIRDVHR